VETLFLLPVSFEGETTLWDRGRTIGKGEGGVLQYLNPTKDRKEGGEGQAK